MALEPTKIRFIDYDDESRDIPGLICPNCDKMYTLGGIDYVNECLADGKYVLPLCNNMCICDSNLFDRYKKHHYSAHLTCL